jgi:hypothetical protein
MHVLSRTVPLLLLLVAACAAPKPELRAPQPTALDAHVPPYARDPYQPFSRAAAIAIALREWRAFGQPIAVPGVPEAQDYERLEGLWQRVGDYWWEGLDPRFVAQRWTGMHDEHGLVFPASADGNYAWSAAFISYVMRMAGAGPHFPYSENHATYIDAAARHDPGIALEAERPRDYAPQSGDLICLYRTKRPMTFEDLPTAEPFPAHCDIVVARRPGQLDVVGGNVDDAVAMKHIPVTADGRLAGPDGALVDPDHPWFVVLKVNYAIGFPPSPTS